jgi:hypothetical protein
VDAKGLLTLSKFSAKAKRTIGTINVSAIAADKKYATEIILKALFAGDVELIGLAKELSLVLSLNLNFLKAVESFLDALEMQDMHDDVAKAQSYIIQLSKHLYQFSGDSKAYRDAVNHFLGEVGVAEMTYCQNLIREFYSFLAYEVEALSPISITKQLSQTIEILNKRKQSFQDIWNDIDMEIFSNAEERILQSYYEALRATKLSIEAAETRTKIAKIIVSQLRSGNRLESDDYRIVLDRIQDTITKDTLKKLFIHVSREFYYFWIEDIDAANYLDELLTYESIETGR